MYNYIFDRYTYEYIQLIGNRFKGLLNLNSYD